MIKIEKQNDTSWYLNVIKHIIYDKRRSKKNRIKEYDNYRNAINLELNDLGIEASFEDIITGDFSLLKSIASNDYDFSQCNSIVKLKNIYKNKFTDSNINNLLVKKLNITTCPYCNRDFINNRTDDKCQAQIDHFFHKSKYPIFALSLYNLIPSCYACNHIKHDNPIKISPYDESYDFINGYNITYDLISIESYLNQDDISVRFKYDDDRIKNNIDSLHIEEAYQLHADYIVEIIAKSNIYTDEYLNDMLKEHEGLFKSKDEMIRMLFGNYYKSEDLQKRPLAKLTRDIIIETSDFIVD